MTKLKNIALAALSLLLLVSCGNSPAEKKIKIGYTNWADCIAITYLTKRGTDRAGLRCRTTQCRCSPDLCFYFN